MKKHELKQLIKEQILTELEPVLSTKKPWTIEWMNGEGWSYVDHKNNDILPLIYDDKYFTFEIPLEFMNWYTKDYVDNMLNMELKDIPQFIKQDLHHLVKGENFNSISSLNISWEHVINKLLS
jgi:hypothetical protein